MSIDDQATPFSLPLRQAMWWYFLCSITIFALMAQGHNSTGGCTPGGIVYCYGDSRDYWWHPTNVIFSFVFAFFLPIPHVLISLFFRAKRNLASALSIAKSWHKVVGLFLSCAIALGLISAQLNHMSYQKLNPTKSEGTK